MAVTNKEFLDLQGLTKYDTKIKGEIPKADEVTITQDSTTKELSIKHPPTVTNKVLYL